MRALLPLLLLLTASAGDDRPRTYLLSIVDFPLKPGESVQSFAFSTWGVEFKAVCRIPGGWRIKAGSRATPDGALEGEGSLGATWFNRPSPAELRNLVLVSFYAPEQASATDNDGGNGHIPTFQGTAVISTDAGDADERTALLNRKNIKLTPAPRCPG